MSTQKLTPGGIVILAGGGVTLLFSFLPFYSYDSAIGDSTVSAWGRGLFPIATYIALFGVLMAAQVALTAFGVDLPERIATFTWDQVHLALGAFATLLAFGYLITNRGGYDLGIGFIFMFAGAIALLVGAILLNREHATGPGL